MSIRILIIILLFVASLAGASLARSQEPDPAAGTGSVGTDLSGNESQQQPLTAKLQIPLPFVPENPDLSDYIRGVYRLAIGLAALFAVVMIIIAGYQWIFSGGSSDKTSAAKKRIFGAVIGLMLALLSYIILNAITQRLVALRLPDVKPVQTIGFSEQDSCNDPSNTVVKQFCKDKANCLALKSAPFPKFTRGLGDARCGSRYLVSGDLTNVNGECGGDVCTNDSGVMSKTACFDGKCMLAYLYGNLIAEQAFLPTLHRRNVKKIKIRQVCGSVAVTGDEKEISDSAPKYAFLANESSQTQTGFSFLGFVACTTGDTKGYILDIEVNTGLLGGINNHYFIGKDCTRSLADFKDGIPSLAAVTPDQLFQKEDFENAQRCDLDTNNFPRYLD